MKAFVIPVGLPLPYYDDPSGVLFDALEYCGIYIFLYPFFLEVKVDTGELINPQEAATFTGSQLTALRLWLDRAKEAAQGMDEQFQQHVARLLTTPREEVYEQVDRGELLETIDSLLSVVERAQRSGCQLCFVGD
jgi:hypothetical protein